MDETYNTKAIILNRQNFRESDSKITLYSRDNGKLELVARGTKKISSKLAGHIEPITLSKLMIVRGKQFDYIGGAANDNSFQNIKNDLEKIKAASKGIEIFSRLIKAEEADQEIYNLLKGFLNILDQKDLDNDTNDFLVSSFLLNLLSRLGYSPELFNCVICKKKIEPKGNKFDFSKGGLVCKNCQTEGGLTITDECIKILRFVINNSLEKTIKIKITQKQGGEIKEIVESFVGFQI